MVSCKQLYTVALIGIMSVNYLATSNSLQTYHLFNKHNADLKRTAREKNLKKLKCKTTTKYFEVNTVLF